MANTNVNVYSDGIETAYEITWAELPNSSVEVALDGSVVTTGFNRVANDIIFDVAPALGVLIEIRRKTNIIPATNFQDGTALTNTDLETDKTQQFALIEEHQNDADVVIGDIKQDIGDVDFVNNGSLQDQIDILVDGSISANPITVTIPSQGRLSFGDVIPAGTSLEAIITDMLQEDTPPVFTLSGLGPKLVESGTLITPTMTGAYTANDAGPSNAYELFRAGGSIHTNPTPDVFPDTPVNIVDTSVTYHATLNHDAGVIPAGSLVSNNITYVGARAAFHDMGGDIVNIRANTLTNIGVSNGSNFSMVGDGASLTYIWAYPDTLNNPTSLFLQNTGGNFDITSDVVQEADQFVDDANASNPVNYKVFSYTALIAIKVTDTLTVTI